MHTITVMPQNRMIEAETGAVLMDILRREGFIVSAACGGRGSCGKCSVSVDGVEQLACQTIVTHDTTVTLPVEEQPVILTDGISEKLPCGEKISLAVDIGTTTVVAYLMENGQVLATESRKNPQSAFGADVVSRIQHAHNDRQQILTGHIRDCLDGMTKSLLRKAEKKRIDTVCVVGNPAMQQLFLGIPVDNLIHIPFLPCLTKTEIMSAGQYVPSWTGARLLTVPDISGYIGADTVACLLTTRMDQTEGYSLLVDIGTNGEMVLGNCHRLVACSTAAGPALEGAGISCGMQAATGAIDHVDHNFSCHVIGESTAAGICGSGLLDAAATALDLGIINERGRILNETRTIPLTESIHLTQEDIRQLQVAKGAIAAGIQLMAKHLNISLQDIDTIYLAGAFGSYLDPRSACRIGLLPAELEDRIKPIGNAAGNGAKLMACSAAHFARADSIVSAVEVLDLAALPEWAKCFSQSMRFDTQADYWCRKAMAIGFSAAVPLKCASLTVRADVRDMCADNRCKAYGKNWTCPPYCGSTEECAHTLQQYETGILIQTVGKTEKRIDTKAYRQIEQQHLKQFYHLADLIRQKHPNALCLGSGGCRVCEICAHPKPCRFPEKACFSMEAYGLFVTQVCRDHSLPYHHGERTVTYTACILF